MLNLPVTRPKQRKPPLPPIHLLYRSCDRLEQCRVLCITSLSNWRRVQGCEVGGPRSPFKIQKNHLGSSLGASGTAAPSRTACRAVQGGAESQPKMGSAEFDFLQGSSCTTEKTCSSSVQSLAFLPELRNRMLTDVLGTASKTERKRSV